MTDARNALAAVLGAEVVSLRPVSGGDVCHAYQVRTADGGVWFAKHHPHEPSGMFALEAAGLLALRTTASGAVGVPAVRAVTEAGAPSAWLVLEWIDSGRATPAAKAALGRGLAQLHRASPPGVAAKNWLGPLPQSHRPLPRTSDWASFWWRHRLAPRMASAARSGQLPAADRRRLEALEVRLPDLIGTHEPMSLLHGDLWSGNHLIDPSGRPWLIDPAVGLGHREVDLAMMDLFGGFGPPCFEAYAAEWPLRPGASVRRAVYQLYYLLVHVELFGAGYLTGLRACLTTAGV